MTKTKYVLPAWTDPDSPQSPVPADEPDFSPSLLDCCEHCEHGVNDPPHDIPCPEGCNQDE